MSGRGQFPTSRHASTGNMFTPSSLSLSGISLNSGGAVEDQNGSQYLTIPGHGMPISLSAPSHKQVFDTSMFNDDGSDFANSAHSHSLNNSPNMHQGLTLAARGLSHLDNSSNGGAVRRHRSMTPSLHRSGDSYSSRRPGTANSMSGEFPPDAISAPRGYHPYPGSSSRSGSATNSPMVGATMGLEPMSYSSSMGMPRRSPPHGDLNIHHLSLGPSASSLGLTGLERPGSSLSVHSQHSTHSAGNPPFGGDLYRTESPTPFVSGPQDPVSNGISDSPSPYVADLPASYTQPHLMGQQHPAAAPTGFMASDQFGNMFGVPMSADGQYVGYAHPQHVNSM